MAHRDAQGHFISDEEYERQQNEEEEGQPAVEEVEAEATPEFGEGQRDGQPIFVDTGRGQAVEVQPGAPFIETLERLAENAHYGGYYRIFLNGAELVNPKDAPIADGVDAEGNPMATIESGMRIAITSYDKVG